MKVIINTDFGGFGLSRKALELYKQRTGTEKRMPTYGEEEYRDDPVMVSIVEELGEEANDKYADLEVVDIPDEYNYTIDEYDGLEHIILKIREDRLRELIRLGNEDSIVEYVKKTQYDYCFADEEEKYESI